jgi:hypothetical protein
VRDRRRLIDALDVTLEFLRTKEGDACPLPRTTFGSGPTLDVIQAS